MRAKTDDDSGACHLHAPRFVEVTGKRLFEAALRCLSALEDDDVLKIMNAARP